MAAAAAVRARPQHMPARAARGRAARHFAAFLIYYMCIHLAALAFLPAAMRAFNITYAYALAARDAAARWQHGWRACARAPLAACCAGRRRRGVTAFCCHGFKPFTCVRSSPCLYLFFVDDGSNGESDIVCRDIVLVTWRLSRCMTRV